MEEVIVVVGCTEEVQEIVLAHIYMKRRVFLYGQFSRKGQVEVEKKDIGHSVET